jgi:hypothetical protein
MRAFILPLGFECQGMPWADFRNLTEVDLKPLFAYLRTVPQVKHLVDNTEPQSY